MDFVVRTCVKGNTEKCTKNFHKKYSECKECNNKRILKRYYKNKEKILEQRRHESSRFKDLDNRLKALEEKLSIYRKKLEMCFSFCFFL